MTTQWQTILYVRPYIDEQEIILCLTYLGCFAKLAISAVLFSYRLATNAVLFSHRLASSAVLFSHRLASSAVLFSYRLASSAVLLSYRLTPRAVLFGIRMATMPQTCICQPTKQEIVIFTICSLE